MADARAGRGRGNTGNANWHSSPLWAFAEQKKLAVKQATKAVGEAQTQGCERTITEAATRLAQIEKSRTLAELKAAVNS